MRINFEQLSRERLLATGISTARVRECSAEGDKSGARHHGLDGTTTS